MTGQIDQDICDNFRLNLAQTSINISTVNAYMISLRAFLQFLKKNHIPTLIESSDIELQKNRDRKVEYLTIDELKTLLESM